MKQEGTRATPGIGGDTAQHEHISRLIAPCSSRVPYERRSIEGHHVGVGRHRALEREQLVLFDL